MTLSALELSKTRLCVVVVFVLRTHLLVMFHFLCLQLQQQELSGVNALGKLLTNYVTVRVVRAQNVAVRA